MKLDPNTPTPLKALAAILVAAGLAAPIVAQFEGRPAATYKDAVGVVTGGYGHTGADVGKIGRPVSEQEAVDWLGQDLVKHGTGISRCIKVAVPVESLAAFESFSFNVGVPAFCGSTLVKRLNAGDLAGACNELSRWDKAGGRVLPGLVKRRAAERALCLQGVK